MNPTRVKLTLLALVSALILTAAPSTASAIGPNLPKPTITGIAPVTNLLAVNFTVSTTVPSEWFVDFDCAYDSAALGACDDVTYPSCTPVAGGQKTCSLALSRVVFGGTHHFRFRAAYCDDATLSECEINNNFYASGTETVSFLVDRTRPIVTIASGPGKANQVLKPGGGTFVFSSNEAATFTCSIDDGALVPCTSPFTVPKYLKNGLHTLFIIATDAAGNQAGPVRNFRVDVLQPKKCKKLKKGSSKRAKSKYKKCKAKNVADKKAWKKTLNLK